MNKELRSCPFCGGEARVANVFGRVGVVCMDCPAEMRGWLDTTLEEITEAWNRREPIDEIVKQLEAETKSVYNEIQGDYFNYVEINKAIEIVKGGAV